MSLIQTYHNKDFGIVCSDGRVSQLLSDGRRAAKRQTAKKFVVLRESPGLLLAGTSTVSQWLDLTVYADVRGYVEKFPEGSFDQVAAIVAPTVHAAALSYAKEVGKLHRKISRFLAGKVLRKPSASPKIFGTDDRVNLNLLGYDRAKMRVRNQIVSCTDHSSEQWEHDSGVTISGDVSTEEGNTFGDKLLELIGREQTPRAVVKAMLSIAAEVSASRPESIGPPYSFHIVARSSIIEEQFRRFARP